MPRGAKNKSLTTRPATGTGTRKTRNARISGDAENIPPLHSKRPKPVPKFKPKPKDSILTISATENDATEAAHALVSLQTVQQRRVTQAPNSPLINRCFRAAMPAGANFESEDSEEEEDNEVDELDPSSEVEEDIELEHEGSELDLSLPSDDKPAFRSFPEFKVPIEVPYRQASRDVDGITSKTPFSRVLVQIAQRMDVSVTHLSGIGYIPSYKPKSTKPVPKLLEDEASWFKLLEDIHTYILSCKGKSGKGNIKPYSISIIDTTAPLDENKSQKKKKSTVLVSDPLPPALTPKESEQLAAFRKLETRHRCQQHKKPCIVQPDGEHYHLTINDLTKWAHLMAENKALLDTPPDELKITDANVRQISIKKTIPSTPKPRDTSSPPEWIQQLMGVVMLGNIATTNRLNNIPPVPNTPSSPLASAMMHKRPAAPLEYPAINTWLRSLENDGQRARKAQGFVAYTPYFLSHGIEDLEDLIRLTNSEILTIIPDINIGIANRLLAFAQEDCSSLQSHKRIRVEHTDY